MKLVTRALLPALLLLVPALVWAEAKKEDKESAVKKLEGTWKVKSMKTNEKEAPPEVIDKMRLTFKGNMISVKGGPGPDHDVTFEIDPSKKPAQITIMPPKDENKDRKPLNGIYKLERDTLTICGRMGGDRPTEFALPDGKDSGLIVLERVKE